MDKSQLFYSNRIKALEAEWEISVSELRRISWIRLIIFVAAASTAIGAFVYSPWLLWGTLVLTAVFGIQVKKYAVASAQAAVLANLLQLNRNELEFLNGNKSVFVTGSDIDVTGHIYATDLDIFGKGSLFQSVNRTGTLEGKAMLVDTLLHLPKDISVISRRTPAIIELQNDVEWRQRFYTIGTMANEKPTDMPMLRKWVMNPEFFFANRGYWIWIARFCSAISVSFVAWMIYMGAFYPLYFFGVIILNSLIMSFIGKDVSAYFTSFGSRTKLFDKFSELFALASKRTFTSELGKEYHSRIDEASSSFKELSQLSNRADQRLNGLVGPVMNGLFLYDIWCINSIEKWRKQYQGHVEGWVVSLAGIDMLSSLANYGFNHPLFVLPSVEPGPSMIQATVMGHPLLPFDVSVKNDYELGVTSKAHIVTGSNMAGKSTFIRTVGLNLILALNGLPVCAKTFSCSVMSIASCIRITDSLEEHASYFRAELMRLEKIVELLQGKENYIVLLDEILRGTNSDDKRMGTLAFFKKLKDYNCLAILATHDLVIGKLEEQFPEHYMNYCFESELRDSELHFDYKLRRGVSASTNATFLMRSLGLID